MLKYLGFTGLLLVFLTACAPAAVAPSDSQPAQQADQAVADAEEHGEEEHGEEEHGDEEHGEEEHGDEEHGDEEHGDEEHGDEEHGDEHRELGAHEHGAAELMIAWSGSDIAVDLQTPAYNVVGFEYAPTSDEEQALLADSLARLEAGDFLQFSADADCTVVAAEVHADMAEGEADHSREEEKSPVEHACKHLEEGPEVPVTAVADVASTEAVTGTHMRLDVTLPGANATSFVYAADEAGEFVFYADSSVDLMLQGADGEMVQAEELLDTDDLADCPGFVTAFVFDLAAGDNVLVFGDTEQTMVRLVVEAAGAEHDHDEHGDEADEHAEDDHDDEVHSDIDAAYNLTCGQPENLTELDAGGLFVQFPSFASIQVQWVSDTQQSAGVLTPDNPVLSLQ